MIRNAKKASAEEVVIGSHQEFPFEVAPRKLFSQLRLIWEQFIQYGEATGSPETPVRFWIVERWRHCIAAGVDPMVARAPDALAPKQISQYIQHDDDFALAGAQVLEDFARTLEIEEKIAALADSKGVILSMVGNSNVMSAMRDANFAPRGLWSEATVGPNGIGTALSTCQPVIIFGPEHLSEAVHPWVCYGSPIRNPVTGTVIGAVDLSGPALKLQRNALDFTISLAKSVERAMLGLIRDKQRRLQEEYLNAIDRWPDDPIIAIDSKRMIARYNAGAVKLFPENPQLSVGKPIEELLPKGIVAQYRAVTLRGRALGAVIVLNVSGAHRSTEGLPAGRVIDKATENSTHASRFGNVIGCSPAILTARRYAEIAAKSDKIVLLTGETGTGKELFAEAIHAASSRAEGPFVAINCAALPADLVESELFGYVPGAFTGASRHGSVGKFEHANGGTIFLDEISAMPLSLQGKLLRVVETKTFSKIGSVRPIAVDCRIVAAANRELRSLIDQGSFRSDLYYRLNVLPVYCPPLRERQEDILLLANFFLAEECRNLRRPQLILSNDAERILSMYRWPGNVRELRNYCMRWAEIVDGSCITAEWLPREIMESFEKPLPGQTRGANSLEAAEREILVNTFRDCRNNVSETARRLRLSRTTVYKKLRQLQRGP